MIDFARYIKYNKKNPRNISKKQMRKAFLLGTDTYPEGICTLLSTGRDDYLVRESDKKLIAINEEPNLENYIASVYSYGDEKVRIENAFDIPFGSSVIFIKKTEESPDKEHELKTKNTKSIVSRTILEEKDALDYLTEQ